MTQVGEGPQAAEAARPVLTVGAPTVGEILAERYQLEEHINNDSAGRQVWRGIDVVLRRPVAVVLRYPGGDSAAEMLQAAVAASRVVHSHLVGVYDAIDEEDRAYVVREWVDGASLRELVAEDGALDPVRATTVAYAITSAVAAVHATGMVHGNVHPGTALIGNDGRVVLADARADGMATQETDIRCIGGVLYFALTGHWPRAEAGASNLPDAVRGSSGTIAAPRQMRAGVPAYLDDLAMDLLDSRLTPPAADMLAAELGRLTSPADEHYQDEAGPLRFADETPAPGPANGRPAGRKIAVGVATLVLLAVTGTVLGIKALAGGEPGGAVPSPAPGAVAPAPGDPGDPAAAPKPKPIKINADQVRIVDPGGDRSELNDVARMVDGDEETAWKTDSYTTAKFGSLKPGMGVLIDLGAPRTVSSVRVQFASGGATTQLRWGARDPGSSDSGDKRVDQTFRALGPTAVAGATHAFGDFDPDQQYQYLLVWITEMPRDGQQGYQVEIQEITVEGP